MEQAPRPYCLAVGDRVRLDGVDGEVIDYDGTGFTVRYDALLTSCCGAPSTFDEDGALYCKVCYQSVPAGEGDAPGEEVRYADGAEWSFEITFLAEIL